MASRLELKGDTNVVRQDCGGYLGRSLTSAGGFMQSKHLMVDIPVKATSSAG